MSRGVVLWPDADTASVIRLVWDVLSGHGLPSLATHTHRLHQPHCSLSVAEHLPAEEALDAVGAVPSEPIPLLVGSLGVFPPNGTLFLACIVNDSLLKEQRRIHQAISPLATDPWPYFEANAWVPHITLSMAMSASEVAIAIPLVMEHFPLMGVFDHGGVEDGSTGENWPAPTPG